MVKRCKSKSVGSIAEIHFNLTLQRRVENRAGFEFASSSFEAGLNQLSYQAQLVVNLIYFKCNTNFCGLDSAAGRVAV